MRYIIFIAFAFQTFYASAQCNEETKKQVDQLKSSIPYPKFNINDTLYIAFINNQDIGINEVTEKNIEVKSVKIINMKIYNDLEIQNSNHILCLGGSLPIEWQYQFVDIYIKSPKIKDCSDFYSESRFSTNIIEAKKALINDK